MVKMVGEDGEDGEDDDGDNEDEDGSGKSCLWIKVKEVMACDVSPVDMFCENLKCKINSSVPLLLNFGNKARQSSCEDGLNRKYLTIT